MKSSKRKKLNAAGWKVADTREFLGLSDEEAALVEMKLALAGHLRQRRLSRRISQVELAEQLGSSQSRIAKMEAADASVSLDLLVRALWRSAKRPRALHACLDGMLPEARRPAPAGISAPHPPRAARRSRRGGRCA